MGKITHTTSALFRQRRGVKLMRITEHEDSGGSQSHYMLVFSDGRERPIAKRAGIAYLESIGQTTMFGVEEVDG